MTLVASLISNLITSSAEVGGVALILNYLTGAPYRLMAIVEVARADGLDVGASVQVDRAHLRAAGTADARVPGRAGGDPPAMGKVAGGFVPHVPTGLRPRSC